MILTVDVGNTNMVVGVYDGGKLLSTSRLATERQKTSDQYAIEIKSALALRGFSDLGIELAALSCVVPPLQSAIKSAIRLLFNCRIIVVGPGVKTGLNIRIENPAILGSDLVCGAVAAIKKYGAPCIVVDLGTATKISAIDRHGSFLGCSIIPGIGISLDALSSRTAQLPHIEFDTAEEIIGTNSVESMRSGIVFGTASMIDGMAEKYRAILGAESEIVSTGGFSSVITPFCGSKIINDPVLVLDGLYMIAMKN